MKRYELNYLLQNGKFAVKYLQELSQNGTGLDECRKAFNHGLAVQQLIVNLEKIFNQDEILVNNIEECHKIIKDLKSGEFNDLLAKEKEKLQQEFDSMKNSLITLIHDYPDIDY